MFKEHSCLHPEVDTVLFEKEGVSGAIVTVCQLKFHNLGKVWNFTKLMRIKLSNYDIDEAIRKKLQKTNSV